MTSEEGARTNCTREGTDVYAKGFYESGEERNSSKQRQRKRAWCVEHIGKNRMVKADKGRKRKIDPNPRRARGNEQGSDSI